MTDDEELELDRQITEKYNKRRESNRIALRKYRKNAEKSGKRIIQLYVTEVQENAIRAYLEKTNKK